MSMYVNFYIKIGKRFAPIGTFNRNSGIGEAFTNRVPFEKVAPITKSQLNAMRIDYRAREFDIKEEIDECKQLIEQILKMDNSVDEKMDAIVEVNEEISYKTEGLDRVKQVVNWIDFLSTIIREAEDEEEYCDNVLDLNRYEYVYAGVEAPTEVVNS